MRACLAVFIVCFLGAATDGQPQSNDKISDLGAPAGSPFRKTPNSAVLISVGGSASSEPEHGTGFLLVRRDDEGTAEQETREKEGKPPKPCRSIYDDTMNTETVPCRILLVTNKHVLPAVGNKSPVFIRVNNREIEIHLLDQIGNYLPTVKLHPDGYDIAIVDVTRDLDKNKLTNFPILSTSILAVHSNPPGGMRALPAALGDTVYILGYPSGIFDPKNSYPILRSGIIATDPHIDFEFNPQLQEKYGFPVKGIKGFLIDAAIFPGSSGSLVLRKPINYEYPYAPYVIGIISDSIPIEDLQLKSEQRMGLAVVYSSDAIIETLALFK